MTGTGFVIHAARRHCGPQDGRYEYRVWPRQAHPAISRLQPVRSLVAAERRSDIYLLPAAPGRELVKLRDGERLEIKRRTHDVGAIQHWKVAVSTRFPLGRRHRADLAEVLDLSEGVDVETGQSPAHLLATLGDAAPAVTPQTVRKSRVIFDYCNCRTEIARVAAGGRTFLTLALESAEFPFIALALDDLCLGTLPNRSYGALLGALFGPPAPYVRPLIHTQSDERRSR